MSKNNWKKKVEAMNEKYYNIPEGWDPDYVVARELNCTPGEVMLILRPGLKAGEFEYKDFMVWENGHLSKVRCFREVVPGETATDQQGGTAGEQQQRQYVANATSLKPAGAGGWRGGVAPTRVRHKNGRMFEVIQWNSDKSCVVRDESTGETVSYGAAAYKNGKLVRA